MNWICNSPVCPVRPIVLSSLSPFRSPTVTYCTVLRRTLHLHTTKRLAWHNYKNVPLECMMVLIKIIICIWPVGDIYLGQKPLCSEGSKPPNDRLKKKLNSKNLWFPPQKQFSLVGESSFFGLVSPKWKILYIFFRSLFSPYREGPGEVCMITVGLPQVQKF